MTAARVVIRVIRPPLGTGWGGGFSWVGATTAAATTTSQPTSQQQLLQYLLGPPAAGRRTGRRRRRLEVGNDGRVITHGVDLAASADKTWIAKIVWENGGARLEELRGEVTDRQIIDAARTGDKLAIDCPLGWPVTFARFVSDHAAMRPRREPTDSKEDLDHLSYRLTDFRVKETRGDFPLSVAANFLGRTAFRCAGLQDKMRSEGLEVDRSGTSGSVIEVYPAISLHQWGIESAYKRSRKHLLPARVSEVLHAATWLDVGSHREVLDRKDDAFDALLCALTARAAAIGRTGPPVGAYEFDLAHVEGWIHIPKRSSLSGLATSD